MKFEVILYITVFQAICLYSTVTHAKSKSKEKNSKESRYSGEDQNLDGVTCYFCRNAHDNWLCQIETIQCPEACETSVKERGITKRCRKYHQCEGEMGVNSCSEDGCSYCCDTHKCNAEKTYLPDSGSCPRGEPGYPGSQGLPGINGLDGYHGDKGHQGMEGLQGYDGVPGEPGDRGYKGGPGAPGPKGERGDKGSPIQGPPGLDGLDGLPGLDGDKGDQGICDCEEELEGMIAFSATANAVEQSDEWTTVKLDQVVTHHGKGLAQDEATFTAPRKGHYKFSVSAIADGNDAIPLVLFLNKNEAVLDTAQAGGENGFFPIGTKEIILNLNKGDKMTLEVEPKKSGFISGILGSRRDPTDIVFAGQFMI